MKTKIVLIFLLLISFQKGFSQVTLTEDFAVIVVTPNTSNKAEIFDPKKKKDFKIVFTNVTKKADFESCEFLLGKDKQDLKKQLLGTYNGAKNEYTVTLTTALLFNGKSTSFIVEKAGTKYFEQQIVIPPVIDITDNPAPDVDTDQDTKGKLTQTQVQQLIEITFENQILPKYEEDLGLKNKNGRYVDRNNVIHLFVDEYGRYYGVGIPTYGTEKDFFQIHLLLTEESSTKYRFSFSYKGEFNPTFNIQNTSKITPQSSGVNGNQKVKIIKYDAEQKGPYTTSFSFDIRKTDKNNNETLVSSGKIKIPKLYHVSISTGLFASTLRNPTDIEKVATVSGDSTLVASDPNSRGILTIMATYYPAGRSFLFPPSGGLFDPSRFGIQVGTQLNDKLAENFFGGISIDFARGGSFSTGVHYGRRSYIAGKDEFNFGEEVFDLPELTIKQEWQLGWYFGVTIDTRVAIELISSLASGK